MASPADTARAYFAALQAHDLDAAVAVWRPGAVDRLVGERDLVAPDGIREYFAGIFSAFPDFALHVEELVADGPRVAVRWRATATFAGPGTMSGFAATQRSMAIEGCDVLTIGDDGLIVHNDAYANFADSARQLGLLAPEGSPAQRGAAHAVNAASRMRQATHAGAATQIADGVWVVRGGFPVRNFSIYLIEGPDGVTVFDAGIKGMGAAVRAAAASRGGIARVVLGHADVDHRGAAPELGAPVYCHAAERAAAETGLPRRDYHDPAKLRLYARPYYGVMLSAWNGGPTPIAGTVAEGDDVAGFRVVEMPGHAPGQIALHRESDGVVLCSDTVYTLDVQTGLRGGPRVAHPAFDDDLDQALASIARLADLRPSIVWPGHADPVTGDVDGQLRAAARGPVG